jgi:carbon monoxide dehydrogenase subunit G
MKVQEQFEIAEPVPVLWDFFEQVDRVARCVPGVEEVTVVDADNSKVRVTQSVGPMSATFDLKMRITNRDPGKSLEFTAVGRSVKGAAGNLRATNTVVLEPADNGSTRVLLDGDLALGGVLGSLGGKVVAKQAGQVTKEFAQRLERELKGEPAPEPAAGGRAAKRNGGASRPAQAPAPSSAPAVAASSPGGVERSATGVDRGEALAIVSLVLSLILLIDRLRSR